MLSIDNLKIAIISLDITWADPEENRFNAKKALNNLPHDIDVAILPELFTTGFLTRGDRAAELAESWASSATLTFLKEATTEYNMAICTSFLVDDAGEHPYNRCVFVEPSGEVTYYDKHHLFSMGNEALVASCGKQQSPIVRFRGWNFAMAVCYDLRFPVWTRNVANAYDILIIPANWPEARSYQWEHLLIARAIENQSYVIGANRSGHDDFGNYDNLSYIFDFKGLPVANQIENVEGCKVVIAECSREALRSFRQHFPVVNDADTFKIL